MDLKEILKKQDLTDEQAQAVMDEMSKNKLYVSSMENPEETVRQLQQEKTELEEVAKRQKTETETDGAAAEEIKKLQETVRQGQINTQLIVALTKAHAADVDYLMYQAEKTGDIRKIKIDDNGKVSGVDELVENLKKTHAGQFAEPASGASQFTRVGMKKLETGNASDDDAEPQTMEEAIARKYAGDEE